MPLELCLPPEQKWRNNYFERPESHDDQRWFAVEDGCGDPGKASEKEHDHEDFEDVDIFGHVVGAHPQKRAVNTESSAVKANLTVYRRVLHCL